MQKLSPDLKSSIRNLVFFSLRDILPKYANVGSLRPMIIKDQLKKLMFVACFVDCHMTIK